MLKNICAQTFWICGAAWLLTLTVVLLKLAYDFVRGSRSATQTHVWMNPAEPVTTSSISINAPAAQVLPPLEPEPSPAPPPKPQPEIPADFVLLCGACRKSIKSAATRVQSANGKTEMRYKCEHCGAVVEVKV
jgi:hypothetical protein